MDNKFKLNYSVYMLRKVGDLVMSWNVYWWDFLATCVRDIQKVSNSSYIL